jgi:hypothetical protein
MSRARFAVVVAVSAYALLFLAAYSLVIARSFAYEGYVYRDPGPLVLIGILALAVAPAFWLKISANRPSLVVCWILYLIAYVPAQVIPYFTLNPPSRVLPWSAALFVAFVSMTLIIRRPPRRKFRSFDSATLFWALIAVVLFVAYSVGSRYGLRLAAPHLSSVYISRFSYRNDVLVEGGGFAYFVAWSGNVINPLLMSYGWVKRKVALVVLGVLGQIALFSLTGFKSLLFSPLVLLALHLAARDGGRFFGGWIAATTAGLVALGLVTSLMIHNDFVSHVFVRRILATPGLLSADYLDFFSTHSKTLFGESLPGINNPYGISPAFVIGRAFFHNTQTSANANLFAAGYAGLGEFGVILMSILAAIYLRFLDVVSEGKDWRLLLGVSGMIAFTLANSSFFTSLQTHGLAFACLLIALSPVALREPGRPESKRQHAIEETSLNHEWSGRDPIPASEFSI